MVPEVAPKSYRPSKDQFRRLAAVWFVLVWVDSLALSLYHGKDLFQSISTATAAALIGISTWVVYRLVSRRKDGLLSVFMAMFSVASPWGEYTPFLASVGIGLAVFVPTACVVGRYARGLRSNETPPRRPFQDADSGGP